MMKQVNIRIPQRILALICGLFISLGAFAQITVKGHVKDDTGEPVFGATIRVVGQQGGTTTDFDGNFSIQAPQGSQIMISFMGFATQTLPARAQMNVTLHEDAKVLDDIVRAHDEILEAHGLYADDTTHEASFDLVVSFDAPDRHAVVDDVREHLGRTFPDYTFSITLDDDISD